LDLEQNLKFHTSFSLFHKENCNQASKSPIIEV